MPIDSATRDKARTAAFLIVLSMSIVLVIVTFRPLWVPLMLGAVLATASYGWYRGLATRLGHRPRLAAAIMAAGLVALVMIPFGLIAVAIVQQGILAVSYVADALQQGGVEELASRLPDRIEEPLRRAADALGIDEDALRATAAAGGWSLAGMAGSAVGALARSAFTVVMVLVAYISMLLYGPRLLTWFERISPLSADTTHELLTRFRATSVSVLGSTVASAGAQAVVAAIGYAIAGVPNVLFFAFLTGVSAMIPILGTPLVTLPIAALMLASGNLWQGVFLGLWAVLLVSTVDNIVKPLFVRGRAQMSAALVFFAFIGGLLAFGPIGLLVGPLAVTFFQTMVAITERASSDPR